MLEERAFGVRKPAALSPAFH